VVTKIGKLEKAAGSTQRRLHKGLEESLPIGVQKSYFMLADAEREVLNSALEKYRPGQAEPILVGGMKTFKPALRLATGYRLVIEEIRGSEVITTYTRWVDAVQVGYWGATEQKTGLRNPVVLLIVNFHNRKHACVYPTQRLTIKYASAASFKLSRPGRKRKFSDSIDWEVCPAVHQLSGLPEPTPSSTGLP
jgi:hypothetical protein